MNFIKNKHDKCNKQVLLVDDDDLFLKVMTHYLKKMGYRYLTAQNGLQAWDCLQKNTADNFLVVLADRIMPKLDGLGLLLKIKQAARVNNIPVIILTGEASNKERDEILRYGAYDFFYKPIYKPLLLAILNKIQKISIFKSH